MLNFKPRLTATIPAFRVDDRTKKKIVEIAKQHNVTVSDVMRQASAFFLTEFDTYRSKEETKAIK